MTGFIRYSLIAIGAIMIFAPLSDPVVRFGVGPCVLLIGAFASQLASLLEAALDDQAVSGTFIWTGYLPADDEIGKPPAKRVSGDFGEQWNYQATEPVVQSLVQSLGRSTEFTVLGDAIPEDHGWHILMNFGGWKCDLLIQWVGHERERFGFRVYFAAHVYHRVFRQGQFCRQTQLLRSSLSSILTNLQQAMDVQLDKAESARST